ncbi:hypothetical protein E3E36_10060 [Thermococcus sp. M36]|uniref:hypothetical protein n=1 Tax=Thermococcus sp. M36 TaxID=1638261 RepID=UPI00143ACB5B|nr:hypothetical protein [Thermococcus sp. M36]NJE06478.1 hypothetical protein [Thermococcus sp. M36]
MEMRDTREMIRDRVKEAVEKKMEGLFVDFLTKDFVEREKYRELLAVWLIAHPELYGYPKVLEVECNRKEYCEVGDIKILEYQNVVSITKQIVKDHKSEIVTSVQNALNAIITNPSSIDEKITARQIYDRTISSVEEGIQKYVETQSDTLEFKVGYESVSIEPPQVLSKSAGFILRHNKDVVKYFENELIENIRVLSKETKLTVVVLSVYPKTYNELPFTLSVFKVVWEVISQGTIETANFNEWDITKELYKSGLIVYSSGGYGSDSIVPPFAVNIWKNSVNTKELILNVPIEVVERIKIILSWRENND